MLRNWSLCLVGALCLSQGAYAETPEWASKADSWTVSFGGRTRTWRFSQSNAKANETKVNGVDNMNAKWDVSSAGDKTHLQITGSFQDGFNNNATIKFEYDFVMAAQDGEFVSGSGNLKTP